MQFLVIFRPKPDVTDDMLRPALEHETAETWEMMMQGILRSIWYLPPDPPKHHGPSGNVILLECLDEADARNRISQLPLVRNDLVSAELLTLNPFDGFELLFAKRDRGRMPSGGDPARMEDHGKGVRS